MATHNPTKEIVPLCPCIYRRMPEGFIFVTLPDKPKGAFFVQLAIRGGAVIFHRIGNGWLEVFIRLDKLYQIVSALGHADKYNPSESRSVMTSFRVAQSDVIERFDHDERFGLCLSLIVDPDVLTDLADRVLPHAKS